MHHRPWPRKNEVSNHLALPPNTCAINSNGPNVFNAIMTVQIFCTSSQSPNALMKRVDLKASLAVAAPVCLRIDYGHRLGDSRPNKFCVLSDSVSSIHF
jgi:hypothetical protein